MALTTVNWVVAAPIPRASTSTARNRKPLSFNKTRKPTRTSCPNASSIITLPLAVAGHPTVTQLNDAVAVAGIFLRMGHLNDGRALGVQLLKKLHDLFTLARVQVAGRFVGENQFRAGDDRARHANELLLATGELTRIQIFFPDDLKAVERICYHGRALAPADFPIRQRDFEILVDRQIIEQMILLEHESDVLVP